MSDKVRERSRDVVILGIQPTGGMHLGQYLGVLRPMQFLLRAFSRSYLSSFVHMFCFVADLHAMTSIRDSAVLARNVKLAVATYKALLDQFGDSCLLFLQSSIPAHANLTWCFNCVTPMGWLNRMTQFKDKSTESSDASPSVGLYVYPNLMSADILLYDSVAVLVGNDQLQHVELTRNIAHKFNTEYGKCFTLPVPVSLGDISSLSVLNQHNAQSIFDTYIKENDLSKHSKSDNFSNYSQIKEYCGRHDIEYVPFLQWFYKKFLDNGDGGQGFTRIMSLRDGTKKMSKSDLSDESRINILDEDDDILRKIMRAKTDSYVWPMTVQELTDRPEVHNLLNIYSILTSTSIEQVVQNFSGSLMSDFKSLLGQVLVQTLSPLRFKIQENLKNPDLLSTLHDSIVLANEVAEDNWLKIKQRVGLC